MERQLPEFHNVVALAPHVTAVDASRQRCHLGVRWQKGRGAVCVTLVVVARDDVAQHRRVK